MDTTSGYLDGNDVMQAVAQQLKAAGINVNIPAYFMADRFSQESSMLLARGKATADGFTYLIKNRDMRLLLRQAVLSKTDPDGVCIIELDGAGTVTYPGKASITAALP